MRQRVTLALDAMGGDHAPDVIVEGAEYARAQNPNLRFLMFGDETRIAPLVARHPRLAAITVIRHTVEVVASDDKPSQALRKGRSSSMWLAIESVHKGEADAVVSAGNTGALMAMAKFLLRTLPGIDRPAIASFFPTLRGRTCMLDLGANVECNSNNLVEFAVMGAAFARIVFGIAKPQVALLNVGVEELKGNDTVKAAGQILRDATLPLDFYGYVEGDDIAAGTVDVIVTDGFTGNIALKTAEGTATLLARHLAGAFRESLMAKIGYLFARRGLRDLQQRMDPRAYNGAMFLGLNGIAVKSHGGADAVGFASALRVAYELALEDVCEKITADLERFGAARHAEAKVAAN